MKRSFFFWLERLRITPKERFAVTLLLVVLVAVNVLRLLLSPAVPYSKETYRQAVKEFNLRSQRLRQERAGILARYQPAGNESAVKIDTVDRDSLSLQATEKININTAGADELETLPGIGAVYAGRIISYREEHGPFKSLEELVKVKGIGKKRLDKLKPFIKLE